MALAIVDMAGLSDVGRQRSTNEDAYFESPPVFAVADGMGGARAGEVASQIAVETLADGTDGGEGAEARLAETARAANRRIYELARSDESLAGMGTTFTAAVVEGGDIVAGHVGDSRLYRLRGGELERLTRDHSLVEELVRRGEIAPEEAETHPQRSIITRALGPDPDVEVETFTFPAREGDVYLLCSDGLTGMVPELGVGDILRDHASLEEAAQRLVEAANEAGGKDNVTVVLFRLGERDDPAAVPVGTGEKTRTDLSATDVRSAAGASGAAAARPEVDTATHAVAGSGAGRQRGRLRRWLGLGLGVVVVAALLVGFYLGSREFYFVGTNERGLVTLYRGLPYDLLLGVELYEEQYVSSVPAVSIEPVQRRDEIIDHRLRERGDAVDLVRQLERGELASPPRGSS